MARQYVVNELGSLLRCAMFDPPAGYYLDIRRLEFLIGDFAEPAARKAGFEPSLVEGLWVSRRRLSPYRVLDLSPIEADLLEAVQYNNAFIKRAA